MCVTACVGVLLACGCLSVAPAMRMDFKVAVKLKMARKAVHDAHEI
jgi:hypothetical protein